MTRLASNQNTVATWIQNTLFGVYKRKLVHQHRGSVHISAVPVLTAATTSVSAKLLHRVNN